MVNVRYVQAEAYEQTILVAATAIPSPGSLHYLRPIASRANNIQAAADVNREGISYDSPKRYCTVVYHSSLNRRN